MYLLVLVRLFFHYNFSDLSLVFSFPFNTNDPAICIAVKSAHLQHSKLLVSVFWHIVVSCSLIERCHYCIDDSLATLSGLI